MTDPTKEAQAAEAGASREDWIAPKVTRMIAGDAEDVGPSGSDGVIGSS